MAHDTTVAVPDETKVEAEKAAALLERTLDHVRSGRYEAAETSAKDALSRIRLTAYAYRNRN